MKKLYLLLFSLLPVFAFTQSEYISDSIVTADCNSKLFERVETLPSIKGGETALSDSLSAFLKRRRVVIKDGKAILGFIVTTKSQIVEIRQLSGNLQMQAVYSEGLRAYSNMWIPAVQNSHKVCDRVRLEVAFADDKITLKIMQGMP